MNYYQKYIKYKEKYLYLKRSLQYEQTGGDVPGVSILANINLFGADMEKLLNPLHGFILINTNVIENYYKFYIPNDHFFKQFMNLTFYEVASITRPTNHLMSDDITTKDFGILLGFLYCAKNLNIEEKISTTIKKLRRINIDLFNFIQNFKDSGEQTKIKYDLCVEKTKQQIEENKALIYKLNKVHLIINSKLRPFYYKKMIETDMKEEYFHVLLAVVWWKANDKAGIKEYYLGINHIFDYLNQLLNLKIELVNIPLEYENDIYYDDELNDYRADNYTQALAISYTIGKGALKIFNYERSKYEGISFPDCGETILRNFFNILLFENGRFDMSILEILNPSEKLKEYYRIFNNINLQVSTDRVEFLNQKLNARDAWSFIVSKLENVSYINNNCDIGIGLNKDKSKSNMLEVIGHLLKDVNMWDDLEKKIKEINSSNEITIELNKNAIGKIKLSNKNGEYEFLFMDYHYDIVKKETYKRTLFTNLTEKEIKTTKVIQNIIPHEEQYFLNIKYTEDLLKDFIINNIVIPSGYYYLVLLYFKSKYITMNFAVNLNKTNLSLYNLSSLGITYDNSGFYNLENIVELNNLMVKDYSKLINLKKITFGKNYNELDHNILSSLTNLTHLSFGYDFDRPVDNLPPTLTHLVFGYNFNQAVDKLPSALTHLTFGYYFNQPVDKLPSALTHLTFGHYFNQPVDKLPSALTHLTFGHYFNQSVDKLPSNLIHLTFGNDFNQSVDKLPSNLIHLTFGEKFNKIVYNLPPLLTHLTFGNKFNKKINNLPPLLTHLILGTDFNHDIKNLPKFMTSLTFGDKFNQFIGHQDCDDVDCPRNLPRCLTQLTLKKYFKKNINKLPSSITHLTLENCEPTQKITTIYNNLIYLYTDNYLDFDFCPNLKELSFRLKNTKIKNYISKSVEVLNIHFFDTIKYMPTIINDEYIMEIPPHIKEIKVDDMKSISLLKNIPAECKITLVE
jgi:hypothetical protein